MGDQSQIRLIEPTARVRPMKHRPQRGNRKVLSDKTIEWAWDSYRMGATIKNLAAVAGCRETALSSIFEQRYGANWKSAKARWTE